MGFFSSFFGTGPQTTKQKQTTAPAPEAMAYYKDLLSRLKDFQSMQYTPYTGQRVAEFTPYQQMSMQGIQNLQGVGAGTLQQAVEAGRRGTEPITTADIQRYQDPYQTMMIDAMTSRMRQQEAEDLSKLQGTSISAGAFGGDRARLAEAQMMRNQEQERNLRISDLMSKGYSQSLSAAQADREAAARGATQLSSLAAQQFTIPQQQLQALYGAGTAQQALEQQKLEVPYQTYLEQRAFPYQQLQYLAGLGTGVGSQMGGTSTGTMTQPGVPIGSPLLGAIGAGIGAFAKSDERAKENIEDVGVTNDGQTIYKYNYKGDPQTHLGLIAQEVEQTHPEAVKEISGLKYVNYDLATKDAVHKADGGGISTPYDQNQTGMFSKGFIPSVNLSRGQGSPNLGGMSAPARREDNTAESMFDSAMALADKMKKSTDQTDPASWKTTTTLSPENPESWQTSVSQPGFLSTLGSYLPFAHGGGVHTPYKHFETGGGASDDYTTADLNEIIKRNILQDKGLMPRETSAPSSNLSEVTIPQDQGTKPPSAGIDQPYGKGTSGETEGDGFLGILPVLSPEAKQSLIVAGLGMMAGRDPNAFVNIGSGALSGVKAYGELMKSKQEQAQKTRELDIKQMEAEKKGLGKKPTRTDMVTENGDDVFLDEDNNPVDVHNRPISSDVPLMRKTEFNQKQKEKLKVEAQRQPATRRFQMQLYENQRTLTDLDKSKSLIGPLTTGFFGVPLSKIPGTDAANLAEDIKSLKARLSFDELQKMRQNSPTGAALGQTTNHEIDLLASAVQSLSTNQSPDHLKEKFDEIATHLKTIEMYQKKDFEELYGPTSTGGVMNPPKTKLFTDKNGNTVTGYSVEKDDQGNDIWISKEQFLGSQ